MAKHPTPGLSYGDPLPAYPVLTGLDDDPEAAAAALWNWGSVHVKDEATARKVLAAVGLSEEAVDRRIWIAQGPPQTLEPDDPPLAG